MSGKFIVFEGGEGCGKTTQMQMTKEWLNSIGVDVVMTREPGGTELGCKLRQLLLEKTATETIADRTELLLYSADRAQHVETKLKPMLQQGRVVLCDRFIDSTIAYQGYGRGLDIHLISQLNQIATGGLVSDVTLWLNLDPEVGLKRKRHSGEVADRIEQEKIAFHLRVQQGYAEIATSQPQRVKIVDASLSKELVQQQIQKTLLEHLNTILR